MAELPLTWKAWGLKFWFVGEYEELRPLLTWDALAWSISLAKPSPANFSRSSLSVCVIRSPYLDELVCANEPEIAEKEGRWEWIELLGVWPPMDPKPEFPLPNDRLLRPASEVLEGGILPSLEVEPIPRKPPFWEVSWSILKALDETSISYGLSWLDENCEEFSLSSLNPKEGLRENLKLPEEGSKLLFGCGRLKLAPCPIAGLDCWYACKSCRLCGICEGMLLRTWEGEVLPLCEDCNVGDVVSGGFQGPFARAPQGSASEDAAKAPEPLGASEKFSSSAARPSSVNVEVWISLV